MSPFLLKSFIAALLLAAAAFAAQGAGDVPDAVAATFARSCAVAGCHQGRYPEMKLDFERAKILASALNVRSQERPSLMIIDPGAPEASYLVKKIRGDKSIAGKRMPLAGTALTEDGIRAIEAWIASLPKTGESSDAPKGGASGSDPTFWGRQLINLPTDRMIDRGHFLFQVSHRFNPPVSTGRDTFYGLDGPGHIFFGLGYGLSDRLAVSIGRAGLLQEVVLGLTWLAAAQEDGSFPVSVAVTAGGGLVTQSQPDRSLFNKRNMRASLQVSLTRKLTDRLSLMIVPGFTTNADPLGPETKGSFGLGFGGRYMIFGDISLIAEWAPVLSGFKADAAGWGVGIEKKIGGHVFQFFVVNSVGLTPGQSIPGGDLKKDVRLGFNIFRAF
jgi:mono/diheme cytochrome c family protein